MTDRVARIEIADQGRDNLRVMLVVARSVWSDALTLARNGEVLPLAEHLHGGAIHVSDER